MNNSTTTISIIITCYNYGKFIDEAIKSALNQNFINYEIIIIDDCSTDEFTKNKIKELQKFLSSVINLKIIALKKNVGVCAARGVGAKEAKGEYLIFLDADDKLHKDCLQEMYNVIEKGQYDMIGCLIQTFGKQNKKEKKINADLHTVLWSSHVHATFLLKKENFFKIGGYDKSFKDGAEDFDFFVRMMENGGKPFIIQKHLVFYRKHGNSRLDNFNSQSETKKFNLRLKVISNSPRMHYDYICLLRHINTKNRRLINKLLILIGFSILIMFMFGFQL